MPAVLTAYFVLVHVAPILAVVGLVLHASKAKVWAKRFDRAALAFALVLPLGLFLLIQVLRATNVIGADSLEVRRLGGALLYTLFVSLPSIFIAGSALLVSSNKPPPAELG